nr:MAG TPA: hypothetical protein [Caudoviricetes sp.]
MDCTHPVIQNLVTYQQPNSCLPIHLFFLANQRTR